MSGIGNCAATAVGVGLRAVVLDNLQLWMDPVPRDGPAAMAVDEWLLERAATGPLLRVYRWAGEWGSLGYFGKLAEARAAVSGVEWVRRKTGGGVVDHREDWTYSLVLPMDSPLVRARGDDSYRLIHAALGEALAAEGLATDLTHGGQGTGDAACFQNPVRHDLVADGRKLAGAGQRRTRRGLLHQGSVAVACADGEASRSRAEALAGRLATGWRHVEIKLPMAMITLFRGRCYARPDWTARR